jgi:thiamine kinase-like enzyme
MKLDVKIEYRLHQYLSSHGIIPSETTWHIQSGGQSNKVWRLRGKIDLICKLYSNINSNPLFNNFPDDEYKCLQILKGKGISPDIFDFLNTPYGKVLLYHFVNGEIWCQNVEVVSELLIKIQKVKPPQELRVLSGSPDDIKNHGLTILNKISGYYRNKLLKICPKVSGPKVNPVLLHTDVVVGNLIQGNSGLRLIDWQCPAIGDPVIDLVMFLSPAMHRIYGTRKLSQQESEKFLVGMGNKLQERYYLIGPLYHWRLAAYCIWKFEQGAIQYKDAFTEEINLLKKI